MLFILFTQDAVAETSESIDIRIKETTVAYEDEITEPTLEERPDPHGGYDKKVMAGMIGLKTSKGQKTLKQVPQIYDSLQKDLVRGDVPADLVDKISGFNEASFKVYSGYLAVPGPINGYDALSVHYQLHLSQGDPASNPVVAWHQGGPGSSFTQGGMIEMGYFQVAEEITVNPHAWNQVANSSTWRALRAPVATRASHSASRRASPWIAPVTT